MLNCSTTLCIALTPITISAFLPDAYAHQQYPVWGATQQHSICVGLGQISLSTAGQTRQLSALEQVVMHKALLSSVDFIHDGELLNP